MGNRPIFIVAGVGVVAALLGIFLYATRGSHIELRGSMQKVRVQAMDEQSAVAVIDFRFVNPANFPFIVRRVDVILETKDGKELEGMVVSEVDARRLFDYFPLLGPKYNDTFVIREKVAPKESLDRMVAARFEVPESAIDNRKRLRIRVEDVDGAASEIVEEERP